MVRKLSFPDSKGCMHPAPLRGLSGASWFAPSLSPALARRLIALIKGAVGANSLSSVTGARENTSRRRAEGGAARCVLTPQ